ncbi:MAG: zinc-ribbon domain-containing protein [Clostridia bacterium]|nr:zinc-ribbon domain-containing protein [Clostridia bacterium]
MKYCPHCGAEIADDVRFCPTCGKETVIVVNNQDPQFDPQDIADNKMLAMLGYLTMGVLPMIGCRNSAFAMHHVNQALWIFIGSLLCGLVCIIPILGWIVGAIGSIFLLVCEIIGIIRALKGSGAYLPFIKGLPVIIK